MEALDHIVVNALFDLDAAEAAFRALGFTVTPRGYHSLGSMNHLMMCSGAYLELVGVPREGKQRQEVLDSATGLSGFVLKTQDADATEARLAGQGFDPRPPLSFSRPVEIDGETRDAKFRTVRLPPEAFSAGRIYFCEHLTPELVWRPEWLIHPNGFAAIDELVVASPDAAAEAPRYAALCGATPEAEGDAWDIRMGQGADAFTLRVVPGAAPRFLSLGLRFAGLDPIRTVAQSLPGAAWDQRDAGHAVLTYAPLDLRLDCRSLP